MFCEKCGAQIDDYAIFCTKCGHKIGGEVVREQERPVDDNEIRLNVKPTFKFLYMIMPTIFIWLMIVLFLCLPILATGDMDIFGAVFGFITILFLVIITIQAALTKSQYNHLTYEFYSTKATFVDSFLNLAQKEVKYKHIREVTMRQSFIQRWFNIGNIVLYTNAETGMGNGINIKNVENVYDVYKKIKEIINI